MARALKTYQTSIGFFDLAVAAPSMKAALEIWGADSNLFHQGFAKESDDPAIIAATVAHPGVVLRRPVGTEGAFREASGLPKNPADGNAWHTSRKRAARPVKSAKVDHAGARSAAANFEKQERKRDTARRKEELATTKKRERKAARVATAQQAYDVAEREHDKRDAAIRAERDELEERAEAERQSWERHRDKLRHSLHRAKQDVD